MSMTEKHVAVLITCHNRMAKTLISLQRLFNCKMRDSNNIIVFLVDDGSTDGTSDAIRREYPQVKVIGGDASLFWNRGMVKAWRAAAAVKPDFYLWLNDDTFLHPQALCDLIQASENQGNSAIIVGTTSTQNNSDLITYGGWDKCNKLLVPNGDVQKCNHFNGNCVLVPGTVYQKLGTLDPYYRHSFGDIDYGYRAKRAGIPLLVGPSVVGMCEVHDSLPKWCNPRTPLISRLKAMYSPLGCNPFELFHLNVLRLGLPLAMWYLVPNHIRAILPGLWVKKYAKNG